MKVVGFVPARMNSSRFPGKPLARILGRTMIEHCYRRTDMCPLVDETYVATCDQEIADEVTAFGGKYVMTSDKHERASDRIAEAIQRVECDIAVLVQGDEPMILPEMVTAAVKPMLADPSIACVNLAKKIETEEEFLNRNCIKTVIAQNGDALCFSRQAIPYSGLSGFHSISAYKQVCIIPFRREALAKYARLSPTPGEIAESVDMMRFLEHGIPVRMIQTNQSSYAVDTKEDLERVIPLMEKDPFVPETLQHIIKT
ncbi:MULTISPECIES: 3-deoxy-manno-octulosonate cytidylyltransferase [Thalassospira]|jgi:3-deoxy-manno-octulosonate cytidylyltransferase (CMP-KDO synthetase)|uniref:3-deoxy-manno-octulosonate cytidylyltransferase n=1 Tax=Thalassospira TaxID=168934 RepID=UPI0007A59611|nr:MULTISPECIES: 3-deoxy-manno-octulosonate cytidylyltransferase [unclassified Thalassospira]KZC99077.1 3-deoxy-manno-octulosonate cytidylyltransferase [Thalassospira sp. MCCC 1A02898]ONH88632.1 3-deoxy-manno-octulosonate cytidylyltransferase [Thalassospira sp. MCCC 1A02803]